VRPRLHGRGILFFSSTQMRDCVCVDALMHLRFSLGAGNANGGLM
jgi:hypothetical protein